MVQNYIMTIQEYFQYQIYKIVNKMLLMLAGSSLKSKYMEGIFFNKLLMLMTHFLILSVTRGATSSSILV